MGIFDISEKCFKCKNFLNNGGECVGDRSTCPEFKDVKKEEETK